MVSKSLRWLPVSLLALALLVAPSYFAGAQPAPPSYLPAIRPPVSAIPDTGDALNFKQIAHVPIMDDFQWNNDPIGMPRGENGDITTADNCIYVGSFIGYQPAVIVDVSDPPNAKVVGPVPDLVPGVGNGIEGIEAIQDLHLLVIDQRQALDGMGFDVSGAQRLQSGGAHLGGCSGLLPHQPES